MIKGFITLSLALVVGVVSITGLAQVRISEGCSNIDAHPGGFYQSGTTLFSLEFYAGEKIVFTSAEPSEGSPTTTYLKIDEVEVDSDGFPGEVSYTFPVDTQVKVDHGVDTGQVTWSGACSIGNPIPPQPSAVIPTLNWLGITALILLVIGITYYRRRRVTG